MFTPSGKDLYTRHKLPHRGRSAHKMHRTEDAGSPTVAIFAERCLGKHGKGGKGNTLISEFWAC